MRERGINMMATGGLVLDASHGPVTPCQCLACRTHGSRPCTFAGSPWESPSQSNPRQDLERARRLLEPRA